MHGHGSRCSLTSLLVHPVARGNERRHELVGIEHTPGMAGIDLEVSCTWYSLRDCPLIARRDSAVTLHHNHSCWRAYLSHPSGRVEAGDRVNRGEVCGHGGLAEFTE